MSRAPKDTNARKPVARPPSALPDEEPPAYTPGPPTPQPSTPQPSSSSSRGLPPPATLLTSTHVDFTKY
ncbi:MAG: hypothetical protein Q9217_006533, partial [Psora testacea]